MKILLFHPTDSTNTGDHIILKGTERILEEAFGKVEFVYQDFNVTEKFGVDLLVVSGTPWFWIASHRSEKYKQLKNLVSVYSDVKKIGLGLGSCYPLTTQVLKSYIYPDMKVVSEGRGDWRWDDRQFHKEFGFGKFDLLFTRDHVAFELLASADIENYETVCPAAFAYEGREVSNLWKPLLIFQNPESGVSKESCDADFSRQYIDFQFKLVEKYNMEIKTASPLDSDWLRDIKKLKCEREDDGGIPYSTWIKNPIELFEVLIHHNPVVSCRVHEAIPSRILGNLTYILPMDTRFLTTTKIGVLPMWPYGYPLDLLDFTNPDLDKINTFTKERVKEGKGLMIKKLREILK